MAIPELEQHCGSWIVTSPAGEVREFFSRANAEKADAAGWKVETAAQYLGRIPHWGVVCDLVPKIVHVKNYSHTCKSPRVRHPEMP